MVRWMVETGESQGVCRPAQQTWQRTRDPTSNKVDGENEHHRLFSELHVCAVACIHLNTHTNSKDNDSNIVIPDFLRVIVKVISIDT